MSERTARMLQRIVLAIALVINAFAAWFDWASGSWAWWSWSPVVCFVWLGGLQVWLEWSRVKQRRDHEAYRWEVAEASGDPVLALAVADYLDRQTIADVRLLGAWVQAHPDGPVPGEPMPDVVAGLFLVANSMPVELP